MAHNRPHLDDNGACLCRCYKCVGIRISKGSTTVVVGEVCICRKCKQDCPANKLHRVVAVKAEGF